jgi:hypothetical protein
MHWAERDLVYIHIACSLRYWPDAELIFTFGRVQ